MPGQPLIARAGRRWAVGSAVAAAIVVAVLGVLTHDKRGNSVDLHITMWVFWHFRAHWLARALLELSDPAFDVGVLATISVGAALRRAWRISALAVVGPVAALVVSENILKPLVHRVMGHGIAFPSGHETGIVSVATVVALLLLRSAAHRVWKAVVLVALLAWAVLAAIGLVRGFFHYPSDTVGGFCVALAVVLLTALVIDAVAARWDRRGALGRDTARTAAADERLSEPVAPDRPRTARAT